MPERPNSALAEAIAAGLWPSDPHASDNLVEVYAMLLRAARRTRPDGPAKPDPGEASPPDRPSGVT